MRILHLLSNHIYTGPAEPLMELIRAQVGAGHDVDIAIDSDRSGDLFSRVSGEQLQVQKDLSLSVKANIKQQIKDFLFLRDVWKSERFDIIHCHKSHEHSLAAVSRVPSSKTKMVRTLNKGFRPGILRRHVISKTDGVLCVAQRDAKALLSEGIVAEGNVVVIGGIVDSGVFCPGDDGAKLRIEAGIDGNVTVAGLVSRIKKGRGHMWLLDSWLKVHERISGAHLIISGRGEWAEKIKDRASDSRYEGTVHVLGYQKDLVRLYRSFDVSVMLAPGNDGTCRGALQAMACEKPLVAADIGALTDIVQQDQTGILCKPGDVDELSGALMKLLSDKNLRLRLGAAARKRVSTFYTIQEHFDKVQALYDHLTGLG